MVGKNEITLNRQSMNEAVQEYLDKRLVPSARVTVKHVAYACNKFDITVDDSKPEADAKSSS